MATITYGSAAVPYAAGPLAPLPQWGYARGVDKIVGIVGLVAILVLVGWGVPPRYRLIAIAGGLAFALLILAIEKAGLWPQAWRTR